MESVAYNGVDSVEGGNIFKNVKFWVAHRVPTRTTICDHIESNGGTIVPLEKNADICIADHARKDAPAGSCSWKLVTESITYGAMQLPDRYRIGPDPELPRQVAAGGLTKSGRTPFTHADDAALAKWVLSHSQHHEGNKIYQDLERQNPRHTWQSWRNRWAKSLKSLPQHKLKMLAQTASIDPPSEAESVQDNSPRKTVSGNERDNDQVRTEVKLGSVLNDGAQSRDESPQGEDSVPAPAPASSGAAPQHSRSEPPEGSESEDRDLEEMRKQFYRDLGVYAQEEGLEIEFTPLVNGKEVDLWYLSSAVETRELPSGEVDWLKVAEDFEYTGSKVRTAAKALKSCYEDSLAGFLSMMADFEQIQEQAASDEEQDLYDLSATSKSPEAFVPSSPPMGFSGNKRPLDPQLAPSSDRSKRRRVSPGAEVPSTPDEEMGVVRQNLVDHSHSPSKRKTLIAHDVGRDIQGSQHLPPLPRPAVERRLEPETQDFGFDQDPPSHAILQTQESTFDVTPSQQLLTESIDATPIPFHPDRGREDHDTSSSRKVGPVDSAKTATPRVVKPPRRSLPVSFNASARPETVASSSTHPQQEPKLPVERTEADGTTKSNRERINYWIEHYQSLGYSHAIVVNALKRTTMTPGGLATIVMQALKDGKGVPTNWEGVWTNRDDESLRLIDSINTKAPKLQEAQILKKAKRESERLLKKHGMERVELRRRFLEAEEARLRETTQE